MSINSAYHSQFNSLCDGDSDTDCHTLESGHTVFSAPSTTSSQNSTVYTLKPQLPSSWLKNTSLEPFICPDCVEICVRFDYDIVLRQHQNRRGRVGNGKETNVRLWTYTSMLEMTEDGERK